MCERAAGQDLDYKRFLAQALETEYQGRFRRGIEARVKLARFPWIKTLDQFPALLHAASPQRRRSNRKAPPEPVR